MDVHNTTLVQRRILFELTTTKEKLIWQIKISLSVYGTSSKQLFVFMQRLIILINLKYNKSAIGKFSCYFFFMNLEGSVGIAEYAGQRLTTVILRRVAICLAPQVRAECRFIFTVDNVL